MEAVKKNAKESGKKSTLLTILSRIKKYWFYLAVSLILTIVTVAGTLYLPILTGRAIDQIIEKRSYEQSKNRKSSQFGAGCQ